MNTENININFIRIVGELGASLGLNRSVGQIYGLLYMSDKPLSLDDLVSKLKMSKGSVSLNIRELERWEAVKKIWVSGSRKDFYEVNPDFINIIYKRTKLRMEKILSNFNSAISDFEKNNSLNKIQKERLLQIKNIQNVFQSISGNVPEDISINSMTKLSSALSDLKSIF